MLCVPFFLFICSNFALAEHMAGSSGDERLANKVWNIFKNLEMAPWNDEHYVQLQVPAGSVHLQSALFLF